MKATYSIRINTVLFLLPDDSFINATKPLAPISKTIKEAANK